MTVIKTTLSTRWIPIDELSSQSLEALNSEVRWALQSRGILPGTWANSRSGVAR